MSLKLSHKYLQQLCRENKASTCGTKQELIDRLLAKNVSLLSVDDNSVVPDKVANEGSEEMTSSHL